MNITPTDGRTDAEFDSQEVSQITQTVHFLLCFVGVSRFDPYPSWVLVSELMAEQMTVRASESYLKCSLTLD